MNTIREIMMEKRREVMNAIFIPLFILSSFHAPKFWAVKVENALP